MSALTNPNPKTDWSIGSTCWYQHPIHLEMVTQGVIWDIKQEPGMNPRAVLTGHSVISGDIELPFQCLFTNKTSAENAMQTMIHHRSAMIKLEIKTVSDLIKFGYENDIPSADKATKQAYRERAKELAGLELPD